MAEWNTRLNKKFFRKIRGNNDSTPLTPEKIEVNNEWLKTIGEPGEMETSVRRERALAATQPKVCLTF